MNTLFDTTAYEHDHAVSTVIEPTPEPDMYDVIRAWADEWWTDTTSELAPGIYMYLTGIEDVGTWGTFNTITAPATRNAQFPTYLIIGNYGDDKFLVRWNGGNGGPCKYVLTTTKTFYDAVSYIKDHYNSLCEVNE